MMNIVLVPNSYLPQLGGLEVATSCIAKELVRAGNSVTIIAGHSSVRLSKEVETSGVTIYRMPFSLIRMVTAAGRKRMIYSIYTSSLSPFTAPKSFLKFLRLLKSIDPDVVNLHYIGENALFCFLAKKFLNFKFVVNLHGNDIDRHNDRSVFSKALTKRALIAADRVLSNSSDILRKAEEIEPSIKDKSAVVGNGIYLEEFISVPKYCHPRSYILSVANFVYKKGQDILIRAFHLLHQQYPNIDLIMAGDGPELSKSIDLAKKLDISESIKFLGRVEKSRIPSLLAGCEVFVLPSRKEPFGIVILEAMASRKAVVATIVGGIPEVVQDGVNGILVKPESPEALAVGMKTLLDDEKKCSEMGKAGYRRVRDKFTWSHVVDRYLEEYEKVL